jgi:hypothetical protein
VHKDTSKQRKKRRHAAIWVPFGSLLVQRDQWDTYRGPKKVFFYLAATMQPWSMADAPVESGPFVARRSPGDRLGSYVYMVSRLHRMRRRFEGLSANSLNTPSHSSMNYLAMASRALGGPKRRRMRRRRLPTTRPTPRGLQEPICARKKCAIWTRWRPVPVKNVNYPRAPNSRRSGLVGPHTTPAIVDYKYMTSTL